MKKVPVTESDAHKKPSDHAPESTSSSERTDAKGEMVSLQEDLDRFRDLAMRSQADLDNYKKRSAREKEEGIKYANKSLLEKLVSIVDHFELGLEAARGEGENSPIYSGMSLVLKQLQDLLSENGLQPIPAVGQKFDPNLHEAIAHQPSDEVPEEHVISQTRRGYRFKDRLLRPSTVVVSSGPAK
jgi:molecular chaperone GrpE